MRERARDDDGFGGGPLTVLAVYVLWALTAVVAFSVCVTWNNAAQRLYVAFGFDKYGLAAYTYTIWITLIVGWLVLVVVAEGLYRRAADEGRLWRRAAWILGSLVGLTLVGLVVGWVV